MPIAAASLAAAAAVVFLLRSSSPEVKPPPLVRASTNTASPEARALIEVTGPPEAESVSQSTAFLSWRATGADFYRVTISDESGAPVLLRETSDTILALGTVASLGGGRVLLWTVDAIADGRAASSGVRRLRLTR